MGDYHDLYLNSDVLILADVFENCRKTGKEYYNLDPAYYCSCPGLAWDAMFQMTYINLELITDIDMYQMVETGLRGGVSYIANRYSKPNNKYLSDYDKNKERIGYNINIMGQSACLVFNPITVNNFASLFNCTPVGRASDSMMAPT